MLQQWQELFNSLDIIVENGPAVLTEVELARFEAENNILLPSGYKEFCQVFGHGVLGDWIRVKCPSHDRIVYSRLSSEASIEHIEYFPSGNLNRDNALKDLFRNNFNFADDFGANDAVFDLRTYSQLDESCDIYWVDLDTEDEDLYRVGRDFFEFVTNFCLGRGDYTALPENKRPGGCATTHDIPQTFTQ